MPLVAVSLVSLGSIGFEVLLVRLFSIVQSYHFAFMAISIALLGYGASGTFIALVRAWLLARFVLAFQAFACLFGITSVLGFALVQTVPFNALALPWNPFELAHLGVASLVLAVPFFGAGTCVGLAFARRTDAPGRVYRYDLTGAALGAGLVVGGLVFLAPQQALRLVVAVGFAAAALAGATAAPLSWRRSIALLLVGGIAAAAVPAEWIEPRVSEYKGLSLALQVPDTEIVSERSGPLSTVTVVRSLRLPIRHVPGLSLMSAAEPPEQLGVFIDGEGPSPITRDDGDRRRLAYLDDTTEALPYHLLERPSVLILGAGTGGPVLLARYHDARSIDAVEIDPGVLRLVRDEFADFAGRPYDSRRVRAHLGEARAFVAGQEARYDLIHIPILDPAAGGMRGMSETYVYTVEAIADYLVHLAPGGILAINRWLRLPPRDTLKLFLTAVVALERAGVAEPGRRLAMIRGWRTTTLLVKNGTLTDADIERLRAFARSRSFDLGYHPGMKPDEANRYNLLDSPHLFDGAVALLSPDRDRFVEDYKFDLRPATDDRPYFFDFFRWRSLPELVRLARDGAMPLIEWGYVVLVATLVQATGLGVVVILLPLAVVRRAGGAGLGRVAGYFLALGLAFLFVEIAFIQKLVLFLGHPLYAVALVLTAFPGFAGLGAGASPKIARLAANRGLPPIGVAVAAIGAMAVLYLVALPPLFAGLIAAPAAVKVAATLAAIAPLAFAMGLPFPLGLARLSANSPELVPWAWGINGCASVASPPLATLLAIHFGFAIVVGLAVALYVTAWATFPAPRRAPA